MTQFDVFIRGSQSKSFYSYHPQLALELQFDRHVMVVDLPGLEDAARELRIVHKVREVLSLNTKCAVKRVVSSSLEIYYFVS